MRDNACPTTGKLAYASRHAATETRGNQRNKGRRMRAYLCDHCHRWHLTTDIGESHDRR